MKLYPTFNISKEEGEAILAVIHLAEYVDRENTASSLIRELEQMLKDACGDVSERVRSSDRFLESDDGVEKILKEYLPKIETRMMRLLMYPVAERIVASDKKVKKEESKYLDTLANLLKTSSYF